MVLYAKYVTVNMPGVKEYDYEVDRLDVDKLLQEMANKHPKLTSIVLILRPDNESRMTQTEEDV